jgi:hypothetical protein
MITLLHDLLNLGRKIMEFEQVGEPHGQVMQGAEGASGAPPPLC